MTASTKAAIVNPATQYPLGARPIAHDFIATPEVTAALHTQPSEALCRKAYPGAQAVMACSKIQPSGIESLSTIKKALALLQGLLHKDCGLWLALASAHCMHVLYEAKCSVDKHGSPVPSFAEFISVRPKGFDGVIFSVNHLADGKTRFFNPIEKMQCV